MKSKLFAIMLAVMMVVSILPTGVFAADPGTISVNGVVQTSGTLETIIEDLTEDANIVIDGDVAFTKTSTEGIIVDKNITINISGSVNGGTINATLNTWGDLFLVSNGTLNLGANLTINSNVTVLNVSGGNVTVEGTTLRTTTDAACTDFHGGNVTIKDGTEIHAITNAMLVRAGTVTIEGGYISSTGYYSPVHVYNTGVLNMNGGKIEYCGTENYAALIAYNGGEITIAGGEVSSKYENSSATVIACKNGKSSGGSIEITGGTIYGDVLSHEDANSSVAISGGVITGGAHEGAAGTMAVAGGTFGEPVDPEFLANNVKQIRIGDLAKPTKRGHDFIGWSLDGINILNPKLYVVGMDVIPVFEANELGNTEILPRLYPLTVIAGEGGTVEGFSGEKDLMIAFGAGRKIEIVPEEGYEIKDVIVNGKYHLGAVEEYKIVSAHMAYSVEAVFAPLPVYTPVYTENFDGEATAWVSGGTADAAVLADGTLSVTSTGGDPNINCPEAFGLACDTIDVIRVKYTNNTENTSFQIFFTNEANPGYSEAGSFKATCVAGANEIVIDTSVNELWTGTLSNMRIDLSNGTGSFVVDSISFETVSYAK